MVGPDQEMKQKAGKCGFFMDQKRRYCGMSTSQGALYCLEHFDGSVGSKTGRVPCPLDPNHTVWASNLSKHVKKCNKLKLKHMNDDEPFYVPDCNLLGGASPASISTQCDDDILQSIPIIRDIYANEFQEMVVQTKSNSFMETHRCSQVISNKKHAIQQSSLIQHLLDNELLLDTSFIEFGCGRAELSRYINQVVLNGLNETQQLPQFTLIDRASNRMKFDSKFKDDYKELSAGSHVAGHIFTKRCKIDIKDLKIDPLVENNRDYVAVSKHLCGVATDLTLRCIANSTTLNEHARLKGLCIAMCCRHVCDADQYVNRLYIETFLEKYSKDTSVNYNSFFTSLRKICSWATSGRREGSDENDTNGHFTNLSISQREQLGQMARRIIDEGRKNWLQDHLKVGGYKVELIKYVPSDVSLENVAMILTRVNNKDS